MDIPYVEELCNLIFCCSLLPGSHVFFFSFFFFRFFGSRVPLCSGCIRNYVFLPARDDFNASVSCITHNDFNISIVMCSILGSYTID